MARRKDRVLYENDATKVFEGVPEPTDTIAAMRAEGAAVSDIPTEIATADIFDTMVAYMPPNYNLLKSSEGAGTCLICGKQTAYYKRKICVDCMDKHATTLYSKTKEAIESGKTVIEL